MFAGDGGTVQDADAAPNHLPPIDKSPLESALQRASSLPEKLRALSGLAEYYANWENRYEPADSLLNTGIELANTSFDPQFMSLAYANYLLVINSGKYSAQIKKNIAELETVLPRLNIPENVWKSKQALAMGYHTLGNSDKARDYAYQALTVAVQMKNNEHIIKSHLMLGDIQRETNNQLEAIRNYLDALTIAEGDGDVSFRMACYDHLSTFYNLIKAYDKAVNYKLKEIDIAEHAQHPDSLRIMTLKLGLEVIAYYNRTLNEKQLYSILDYADRNHQEQLHQQCLIALRNHLIKQNDFAQLYNLFHEQYPADVEYLRVNDTTTYFRMEAFFYEYLGKMDSAVRMFEAAARRLDVSQDILRSASFYLRYGDFYMRRMKPDSAEAKYRHAYDLAASISYFEYMLEASRKLESVCAGRKDYAQAYQCSLTSRSITDSLDNIQQREQLQLIELENEETLRVQRIELADEATRRRNNIQYTAITILIASIFIILFVMGGVNVHPTLIRMLGFLCFILFFEFIVLLMDNWIKAITHEIPWEVLGIKILIMSALIPFHNFMEKRVTHHLIHKKMKWMNWRISGKRSKTEKIVSPPGEVSTASGDGVN